MSDMWLSMAMDGNFPGSQRDKDAIEQWAELNVPAIAVAAVKAAPVGRWWLLMSWSLLISING